MKLKPCPFCAREPKYYVFHEKTDSELWSVACDCGAESPGNSKSKSGAARIWNRRRLENIDKQYKADVIKYLQETLVGLKAMIGVLIGEKTKN